MKCPGGPDRKPRTDAGRRLNEWAESDMRPLNEFEPPDESWDTVRDAIVAIEREARAAVNDPYGGLDVDRLTAAYWAHRQRHLKLDAPCEWTRDHPNCPALIAAEYGRLPQTPDDEA